MNELESLNAGLASGIPIRTDVDDELSTIQSSSSSGLFAANCRNDGDQYASYVSSDAWKTNPARLAELKGVRHRCRVCNAAEGKRSSKSITAHANISETNFRSI